MSEVNTQRTVDQDKPRFVPATDFFKSLNIHFEIGTKLVALGVLRPDATLNDRPIFLADLATVEKARLAIAHHRARQNRARQNLRELNYV